MEACAEPPHDAAQDETLATTPPSAQAQAYTQATTVLKEIAFGSVAGIVGKIIEYPFDTIKVRLQATSPPSSTRSAFQHHYNGPLDVLVSAYRTEGLGSLYRGISAPLIGAAIETSSLFFSYRVAQDIATATITSIQPTGNNDLPLSALLVCGAASGAFTSLFLTPIELIKCKMQVPSQQHPRSNPIHVMKQVFRQEGFVGFWHGQFGTLIRETGGSAAWFGGFEGVKAAFLHQNRIKGVSEITREPIKQELYVHQQLLAGATAGILYNFMFYPADTIKSRMQTEDLISSPGKKKQAFLAVGRDLWKSDGIRGFYRGCGITVMRSAPSSAVIFAVYETLKDRFG
ncbi:MAG: hypothetical protein Q9160_004501 [Pyrenula sp. 1 TL-2023]